MADPQFPSLNDTCAGCALSAARILAAQRTVSLGRAVEYYTAIDSTNRRALEWAAEGAPDGALVIAEEQTAGRGRLGRRWHAPACSALLFSLVLRPDMEPTQAQRLTMICSLGVLEAIEQVAGLQAQVKWPNDVVIDGRKAGGILTELAFQGHALRHSVVGIGLNVNLDVSVLPDVLVPAASLMSAAGGPISREDLLSLTLAAIERRYLQMAQGWSPHAEWREHLATLGTHVRAGTPGDVLEGLAVDVDADGALLVLDDRGEQHRVLAGDVTLRGHSL
ncbi:MAG: biotin--[acetyl-CoA-carboxylase] ligase [Anaerolineae bacterium]|nr:biotin--[acetyl-CoA-carboxylase] ligase [Chloroflexota bacterium]